MINYFVQREVEAPNSRWQVRYEQVEESGRVVNAGLWHTFDSRLAAERERDRMRVEWPDVLPAGGVDRALLGLSHDHAEWHRVYGWGLCPQPWPNEHESRGGEK